MNLPPSPNPCNGNGNGAIAALILLAGGAFTCAHAKWRESLHAATP